ncbi:hypothetical protein BD770DRAFT_469385 [Pilaira anomala]|nr:hypothetical protein BD770DRAFT_469385 [Pilaira anomala]
MDGKYDQAAGNIKKNVGSAMGNERMQGEGHAQHAQGQTSETASKAEGYVQGLTNQVKGAVGGAINSLTGNTSGEAGHNAQQKAGSFYIIKIS